MDVGEYLNLEKRELIYEIFIETILINKPGLFNFVAGSCSVKISF